MKGSLTIVSCGLGPADLPPRHLEAVKASDVLVGGDRLLGWFPNFSGGKVSIGAHAIETVLDLITLAETNIVTVLASGDSLFFGIARLFIGKISPDRLTILPNVTAVQAAMARLHMPWQRARFFTVHGRKAILPWRDVLRAPIAAIYCDGKRPPSDMAAALFDAYPAAGDRSAAIVADLGAEDEDIQYGTLATLRAAASSGMSMLIVREPTELTMVPPLPLGREDDTFDHEDSPITHPEVRAVVLSKLQLRGGLLWDLGAGSGSVSIEATNLCGGLRGIAVEQNPERCEQIRRNADAAGCRAYKVIEGDIVDILPDLPPPHSVFVGGGGRSLAAIVEAAYAALQPGGVLVATAVLEESRAQLLQSIPDQPRQLCQVAITRSHPLGPGTLMRPENAVTIFSFRKDCS